MDGWSWENLRSCLASPPKKCFFSGRVFAGTSLNILKPSLKARVFCRNLPSDMGKKHAKHMGIACTVIENWGCEETNLLIFQLILGVPNQHDFCYMVFLPNSLAIFHSTSFFFKLLLYVILCHFVPEFVDYSPAICLDFAWILLCYIPILSS